MLRGMLFCYLACGTSDAINYQEVGPTEGEQLAAGLHVQPKDITSTYIEFQQTNVICPSSTSTRLAVGNGQVGNLV
jgi:hypothetical protein